jgi:hypothetical protein
MRHFFNSKGNINYQVKLLRILNFLAPIAATATTNITIAEPAHQYSECCGSFV